MKQLGVYTHIPFCATKCTYCSFVSSPALSKDAKEQFVARVVDGYRETIPALRENYTQATLYFGGGTPSNLPVEALSLLIETLHHLLQQKGIDVIETTVEINPADYCFDDLLLLKESKVTRLSVGVQSLNDDELKQIKRRHNRTKALETLYDAVSALFPVVSADLIYGLPLQTPESFRETLAALLDTGIDHCSIYELTPEKGTPLFHLGKYETDEERLVEYSEIAEEMTKNWGLARYEISNYARSPSARSSHNLHYWRQGDYLGFGPSAVSTIGRLRRRVDADLPSFLAKNETVHEEILSDAEFKLESIMLPLRTTSGVEASALMHYQSNFLSPAMQKKAQSELHRFVEEGWMEERDSRIRLSSAGFLLYNEIVPRIT